ncbi:MmcQ/YjbR family DNA-binding protein [Nakamurella endophytica]|nr:MmcQ/YjbR family DNA-binding protein [Nakamurella endophytica]
MPSMRDQARSVALGFPEVTEDHPWEDDRVVKVRKKIFLFLGADHAADEARIGVKLTDSLEQALGFDGVEPSRYGLGRHGWVTVAQDGSVPVELVLDWVEESYRTVAPATLVRQLDAGVDR